MSFLISYCHTCVNLKLSTLFLATAANRVNKIYVVYQP